MSLMSLQFANSPHGLFYGKAKPPVSIMEWSIFQPQMARKLRKSHGHPFPNDDYISSLIIGLFSSAGPATISGFVVATIINPLKRQSGRTASHVFNESREIVDPAIAHRDASATIESITGIVSVETSSLGGGPDTIFPCPFATLIMAVLGKAFLYHLNSQATTAPYSAIMQRFSADFLDVSAVTPTFPVRASSSIRCSFKYNKAPKPLTGQIIEFHHDFIIPEFSVLSNTKAREAA